MKKNIYLLTYILLITSCGSHDSSSIVSKENVDWSNDKYCSVSVDTKFIDNLIENMTLEQKVGQIIMPDIDEVTPEDARNIN